MGRQLLFCAFYAFAQKSSDHPRSSGPAELGPKWHLVGKINGPMSSKESLGLPRNAGPASRPGQLEMGRNERQPKSRPMGLEYH